jgi:hypothetical protein
LAAFILTLLSTAAMGAPKIVCPNANIDFGEVYNLEKVEAEFIIRNEGDSELEILKLDLCSGMMVDILSKEDKHIAAGGELRIVLSLTLANRQGEQWRSYYIKSNDPETPQLNLRISAIATWPIMREPVDIYLGTIGDTFEPKTLFLHAYKEEEFTIESVACSLDQIETTVQEVTPNKEYSILLESISPLPKGDFKGKLDVVTSNISLPIITVNVYGRVADFYLAPEVIRYRHSNSPNTMDPVLQIGPGGIKKFQITGVIAPLPNVGIEIMQQSGSNFTIQLIGVATSETLAGKELIIETDGKGEIRVPFEPYAFSRHTSPSE